MCQKEYTCSLIFIESPEVKHDYTMLDFYDFKISAAQVSCRC